MKNLSLVDLQVLSGGSRATDILDWTCGGAGGALAIMAIVKIAIPPVGAGIGVACGVYGLGRAFDFF